MPERDRCPKCGSPIPEEVAVATTSEFTAPTAEELARLGVADAASESPPAAPLESGGGFCAWCGRLEDAGTRMLRGATGVCICDGCVALCYSVLQAERPGWPQGR